MTISAALLLALMPVPVVPVPDAAAVTSVPSDAPRPEEAPGAAAFGRAFEQPTPTKMLATLDEALALLPRPTRFRGIVQCTRAGTLAQATRVVEAVAAAEECNRLRPEDPRGLWLLAVLELDHDVRRGVRLLIAAIRADPAPVAGLDREAMSDVVRKLDYAGGRAMRADLVRALAAAGWRKDDPGALSAQVARSVRDLVAAGDTAGAVKLLPLILSPAVALKLLVDRRLDPIRDELDGWAGGTLSAQRSAYRAAAKAAFERAAGAERRLDYAVALVATGDPDGAVDVLKAGAATNEADDDPAYYRVQAAVSAAAILADLGRGDEGLAIMHAAAASLRADDPVRRNIAPNEVKLLIRLGRHKQALALLDRETPRADQVENAAALGFYVALRTCALAGEGRTAAARAQFIDLRSRFATNISALDIGFRCAGSAAERRSRWLAGLDDADDRRTDALLVWARAQRPGAAQSRFDEVRDLATLRDDAVLRSRMEMLGRRLPESLGPALDGWWPAPPLPVKSGG